MNILIVLTSHGQLGDTGEKTGFWLEEFAAPYYVFRDAGADVVLASPLGGQPPLDPKSDAPDAETEMTRRFDRDGEAQTLLANTWRLNDVSLEHFDALFFPGGHGPLWDLTENPVSIAVIAAFIKAGKPVVAICHAPAALLNVRRADGQPLLEGKRVTGFSNSEEQAVQLVDVVPFLLEDRLRACGGHYSKGPDWEPYVVSDGLLVTGQNPASSELAAQTLLDRLRAD